MHPIQRLSGETWVEMRILNLYCGIGGNRKLWGDEHEVTAVEFNPEIAKAYQEFNISLSVTYTSNGKCRSRQQGGLYKRLKGTLMKVKGKRYGPQGTMAGSRLLSQISPRGCEWGWKGASRGAKGGDKLSQYHSTCHPTLLSTNTLNSPIVSRAS